MMIVLVMIYVLMIKINASMQIVLLLEMLDIVVLRLNLIKGLCIKKVWAWVVYLIVAILEWKMNLKLVSDLIKFIMVVRCKFVLDII